MPGVMPKKKYYPGYQGGGVAKKNPISRGLGWLRKIFKDYAETNRRLKAEGRSLDYPEHPPLKRNSINPTEERREWIEYGPPYPVPHVPPNERDSTNMLRELGRKRPRAADGGVIPGYQAGGGPGGPPRGMTRASDFLDPVLRGRHMQPLDFGSTTRARPRGGIRNLLSRLGNAPNPIVAALAGIFGTPEELGYSDEDREAFLRMPEYPTLTKIRETGFGPWKGMEDALRVRRQGGYDTGHRDPVREMILEYGHRDAAAEEPIADRVRRLRGRATGGVIPGYQTGGQAPVQQRMVQSYVAPEQAQLAAQLTGNIQNIATQPYQAYGGQRLAGTTQDQALARAAYGAYGRGTGPAGTQQAADAYTQAQGMVGGAAQGIQGLQPQYGQLAQQFSQGATGAQQLGQRAELQGQLAGAGMRGTGRESQQQAGQAAQSMRGVGQQMGAPQMQKQANLQDYMSQYTKGVTDPQLAALREFQQIQGQELASQAATSGNLGSMRQGVQAAQQARDVSQQAAGIIGEAQQKAFESAQQAFQADRAAQQAGLGQQLTAEQQAAQAQAMGQQQALTAQQQGYQAAQGGTQLGLQGLRASGEMLGRQQGAVDAQGRALGQMAQMGGQMAGIAGGMGTQAQREQQMQMQRLQAMEQAGARTQQEQQRDLDIGYQDFQAQRDYPQQQTQAALGMMQQLPYQSTQVISDYQADPGTMSDFTGSLGTFEEYQTGDNPYETNTGDTADATEPTPDPNALEAAGGGYVGESNAGLGIMGPLHKRIIDGLYAGGRISYR